MSNTEHCVPSVWGQRDKDKEGWPRAGWAVRLSRGEDGNSHFSHKWPKCSQCHPAGFPRKRSAGAPAAPPAHLSARLGAWNHWEFKKHGWWEGRKEKTSKARTNHLNMVSSVPFGDSSLAVTLGNAGLPLSCLSVLCRDLRHHWASTNMQLIPCLFPKCLMKTSTKQSREIPGFLLMEEFRMLLYFWARQQLRDPSGSTISGTTQVAQMANIWATGETDIGMWKAYE